MINTLIGAVAGALLLCVGMYIGQRTAGGKNDRSPENTDDIAVNESDSKRDRVNKLNRQWDNLMAYTGKRQVQNED